MTGFKMLLTIETMRETDWAALRANIDQFMLLSDHLQDTLGKLDAEVINPLRPLNRTPYLEFFETLPTI